MHNVLVALMACKAEVEFDPSRVLPSQIANSITELGFPSTIIEEESGAGKVELEVCMPFSKKFFFNNGFFTPPSYQIFN